jgi:CubicO group peptidase (beta-lactamase class C family)
MNEALPRTTAFIEQGVTDGLHVGAQLFVARGGQTVLDYATGLARPGVAMTPDHLVLWMSSTKPMAAVAIAQLWEQGRLDLDDPIARHIPEFGQKGKEAVTIRHLLTHTGGFRAVANSWKAVPVAQYLDDIYNARLEAGWVPGRKAGYHVASSWFVLGELIRRIDGRPFEQYVRDEIFLPLGMTDCWVGMPETVYDQYGDRIAFLYATDEAPPTPHPLWNLKANATMCRPAANGYGPAHQLARFYQMLLNKGRWEGKTLIAPQTVDALTSRHRTGMFDQSFRQIVDWCLGFIPNNNIYGAETVPYGYGLHAGPRAFGHSGQQSSVGMADPDYDLVVVVVFNGAPGEARHNVRIRQTMTILYEELSLG